MKTQSYMRKPFEVEAVQVTAENLEEVAEWAGGMMKPDNSGRHYVKIQVKHPLSVAQTMAFPGDWVLKVGHGFKIYGSAAFDKTFEPLPKYIIHTEEMSADEFLRLKAFYERLDEHRVHKDQLSFLDENNVLRRGELVEVRPESPEKVLRVWDGDGC